LFLFVFLFLFMDIIIVMPRFDAVDFLRASEAEGVDYGVRQNGGYITIREDGV
jgi:hypothetical protein